MWFWQLLSVRWFILGISLEGFAKMVIIVDEFGNKLQPNTADTNIPDFLKEKAKAYFLNPQTRNNQYKICVIDFDDYQSVIHEFEFSISSTLY
jgi:hypothetical protein